MGVFNDNDKNTINEARKRSSLNMLVEKWLERLPFMKTDNYDFWQEYQKALDEMIEKDRALLECIDSLFGNIDSTLTWNLSK